MQLKSVAVYVTDQSSAQTFYSKAFGFKTEVDVPMGAEGSSDRWLEMALPNGSVRIILSPASAAEHFEEEVGGWTNIIFGVDDLDKTVEMMQKAGAHIVQEPQSFEWGRWAEVADPDGNRFGLSEERG